MRVTLLSARVVIVDGRGRVQDAGETVDVSDAEAMALISGGVALAASPETASIEPTERAVTAKAKRKTGETR